MARLHGRLIAGALAAATAGVAIYEASRGGWLGGSILLTAAHLAGDVGPAPAGPPACRHGSRRSRSMLGVAETASRDEIEAAYRRLMLRAHPDKGGSAGLAAQLNAARERLLRPRSPSSRG